ncbi:hypothetical protein BJX70DRAFT_382038 [Aspergillus crustosus]
MRHVISSRTNSNSIASSPNPHRSQNSKMPFQDIHGQLPLLKSYTHILLCFSLPDSNRESAIQALQSATKHLLVHSRSKISQTMDPRTRGSPRSSLSKTSPPFYRPLPVHERPAKPNYPRRTPFRELRGGKCDPPPTG